MPDQDADELARNVGRRISEIRREGELTQQGLATLVQATVQWVSRVETGRENLTLATMAKLANALGVAVIDFFAAPKSKAGSVGRGRPRKKS